MAINPSGKFPISSLAQKSQKEEGSEKFHVSPYLPYPAQEEYRQAFQRLGFREDTGNAASVGTKVLVTGKPTGQEQLTGTLYKDIIPLGDEFIKMKTEDGEAVKTPSRGNTPVNEFVEIALTPTPKFNQPSGFAKQEPQPPLQGKHYQGVVIRSKQQLEAHKAKHDKG